MTCNSPLQVGRMPTTCNVGVYIGVTHVTRHIAAGQGARLTRVPKTLLHVAEGGKMNP